MKTRLSTIAAIGTVAAGATAAHAGPIEVVPETGSNGVGVIRVDGPNTNGYTNVRTQDIVLNVSVRGDRPRNARGDASFSIKGGDSGNSGNLLAAGALTTRWTKYRLSFGYIAPNLAREIANVATTPVDFCNRQLRNRTGQSRRSFLKNGSRSVVDDAYTVRAQASYRVREGAFLTYDTHNRRVSLPVSIRCMPLDRARARTSSTTSTERARERARQQARDSAREREPQRTAPPPITTANLRIEPTDVQNVNGQLCATRVRLVGTLSASRAFTGKAAFVGPGFLSPIQNLSFTRAGNKTLRATADIDWSSRGGLTANPGRNSARQKTLTFKFNISDASGELARRAEASRTVICAVPAAVRAR